MPPNPTPLVIELAQRFRAQLLARERRAANAMVRFYGVAWQQLQPQIVALNAQVTAMTAAGREIGPGAIWRLERMKAIQAQAAAEAVRYAEFADTLITAGQREALVAGQRNAHALIVGSFPADAGLEISFATMPAEAAESLVGFLQNGSPLHDLLLEAVGGAAQDFGETMVSGLVAGWNPRRLANQLRQSFGMGLTRSLRIARTEQLRAYRTATLNSYNESDLVTGWRRLATHDRRVCMACVMLDNKLYGKNEPMDDHVSGRCHPGGTLASGPLPVAATSRHYSGQLISIRTASGAELSFTPNHPILTLNGWMAGNLLVKGDYVISSSLSENATPSINKDDYQVPARIEEIAITFAVVSGEMPSAAEDFHGDGEGSEVYIVGTNSFLRNRPYTPIFKPLGHQGLGDGLVRSFSRTAFSNVAAMLKGMFATSAHILGNLDPAKMFLHRRLCGQQPISFRLRASANALAAEAGADDTPGDAIGLGKGILRFPVNIPLGNLRQGERYVILAGSSTPDTGNAAAFRERSEQSARFEGLRKALGASVKGCSRNLRALASNIHLDRILEVSTTHFLGHVYSLQTTPGWYIARSITQSQNGASGIVVQNCAMVPITKSYAELGIDAPEPDFRREMAQDWFLRQDEGTQRTMMGTGQFDAWRAGEFRLTEIPKLIESNVWGNSWVPSSLGDLIGG